MSNRFDIRFIGHLVTEQPLAHCPPLPQDVKSRDNVSRLGRIPARDGFVENAFINGSAMRGPVRRAADRSVRALLGNPKVPFVKALQSRVGGAKGSEDTVPDFKMREKIRKADPVLSLFGAGSSPVGFLEGRVAFSHLIPVAPVVPMVIKGVRRAENRSEEFLKQLDADELDRADQYGAANAIRSKIKAEVKTLETAIRQAHGKAKDKGVKADTAELDAALKVKETELDEAEKRAANLGSDNAVGMPLAGYEALPTGVIFNSQIVARNIDEGEAAVLIDALKRWAFNPRIGAKEAANCGVLSGKWRVEISTDDEWVAKGEMTIDGLGGFAYTGPNFAMPTLDLNEYLATV